MIKDTNAFELEFSNFVNSYIKRIGGKGPRLTETRVKKDTIIYYTYGILTEKEQLLLQLPEGEQVVFESRRLFLKIDKENRVKQYEEFLGHKIIDNYESWNFEYDSAIGVFKLEKSLFP